MKLVELSQFLLDEKKAEQYLLELDILKTFTHCEKCESTKLGRIRRDRYKCYSCKAEWSIRKNSILENQSISCSKFLGLVKLFELDRTATETSNELNLGLRTTQRIYNLFREVFADINDNQLSDKILSDNSPTFSIEIINGIVDIGYGTNLKCRNLFKLKRCRILNRETSFYFHHSKINSKDIRNNIDRFPIEHKRFWRYANIKIQSFRETKLKYLYLFLKEVEFRYNNQENLFERIVEKTANFKRWS